MIEVAVGGGGQFEGSEADIVKGFVVDAEGLVRVLNQLVDWQGCVVGLHHGVWNLWL